MKGSGEREIPEVLLPPEPGQLEPVPSVGGVRLELPKTVHHRAHPVPMYPRVPTSIISLFG